MIEGKSQYIAIFPWRHSRYIAGFPGLGLARKKGYYTTPVFYRLIYGMRNGYSLGNKYSVYKYIGLRCSDSGSPSPSVMQRKKHRVRSYLHEELKVVTCRTICTPWLEWLTSLYNLTENLSHEPKRNKLWTFPSK